jgi:PPOX class probable F420-dependent enzyme
MSEAITLAGLGDEQFVSLTTFRRSGEPVATPVWVARDAEALVVTTPGATGKVRRLRRDPRVELRPSTRRGAVDEGVRPWTGVAAVLSAPAEVQKAHGVLRGKYGLQFRLITALERVLGRGSRERVILRITSA